MDESCARARKVRS